MSGHGTYSGAQWHRKRGESPCGPCLAAQAAYMREYRYRTGRTTNVHVPLPLFQEVLRTLPMAGPLSGPMRSLLPLSSLGELAS